MQLSKLLKHYKLSPQQLKLILDHEGITCDLRTTKTVPNEWNQLLSEHTGIPELKDKEPNSESSAVNTAVLPTEKKGMKEQLQNAIKPATRNNKEEYFVAYIKFVAKDKSHGFVKRINDIASIDQVNFREKDELDYALGTDINNLHEGQLIICTPNQSNRRNVKNARLVTSTFKGIINKQKKEINFTVIGALEKVFTINLPCSNERQEGIENYASLHLYYDKIKVWNDNNSRGSFKWSFTFQLSKTEFNKDALKLEIETLQKNILAKKAIEKDDKFIIDAYKLQVDETEFNSRVSEIIQHDIEQPSSVDTFESIRDFISKWNCILPDTLKYNFLKGKIADQYLFDCWKQGYLVFEFWGLQLISLLLEQYKEVEIGRSLSTIYKGNLNEQSNGVIEESLDYYFSGCSKLTTRNASDNLRQIIAYLPEGVQTKYLESLFVNLEPKLQLELWVKSKDISFPRKAAQVYMTSFEAELDKTELQIEIVNQLKAVLAKKSIKDDDKFIIDAYKLQASESDFNNTISKIIKQDIEQVDSFDTPESVLDFIGKWNCILPEALNNNLFKGRVDDQLLYEYWKNGELVFDFWGSQLVTLLLKQYKEVKIGRLPAMIYKGVLNDQQYRIIDESLQHYFSERNRLTELHDYNNLLQIIAYLPEDMQTAYIEKAPVNLEPKLQLDLWLKHKNFDFPQKSALRYMASFDVEQQKLLVEHIEDRFLPNVFNELKEINSEIQIARLLNSAVSNIVAEFDLVAFDLEVNAISGEIFELAYGSGDNWEQCVQKKKLQSSLNTFEELTKDNSKLFIGHNIIEFDCPILKKSNIHISSNKLWDTMQFEMLLSPEFLTFALKTDHHAIDDAKLCYHLFINQLLRVLKLSSDDFKLIITYFPTVLSEKIKTLRNSIALTWLPADFLDKERNDIFRPQPKSNPVIKTLKQELSKQSDKTKLIIAPHVYEKELLKISNIEFNTEDIDDDFRLVSKSKVDDLADENDWSSIVLKRYLNYCTAQHIEPYWGNLAVSIKIKLTRTVGIDFILEEAKNEITWKDSHTYYTTVSKLKQHKKQINEIANLELFILDPDLLSVSYKKLLSELNINKLLSNDNINHLWMKFSGGLSNVALSKEQALQFINTDAHDYSHYWLEKYQFEDYRLYGTYNWEEEIDKLKCNSKHLINPDVEDNFVGQVQFTTVKSVSANSSKVVRYNPETIYRSRYWVYQKMLLQQIDSSKPFVLLIQRREEIEYLTRYFSNLGYFIPNNDMPLGRQLERLHDDKAQRKMLIAPLHQIGKILHANYLGPLSVVVDSFHLTENSHTAKGTSLFKRMETQSASQGTETDEMEEDNLSTTPNLPHEKDTFFLLKLQLPYINYLRTIINANDKEHQVWLLDPRISDFPELGITWKAKRIYLSIWSDPESYEDDAKEADKYINTVKPSYEIPYDHEEIKKLLSKVFLGNGHDWYDYQHEYLDKIIPGKEDFLVSLPTGGGKSLLFQAPSIFKSTFTNRLTLVVTPLKALMEDQVKGLWQKGFIGSVEYINSDRSNDVQLIYRSLAGGELSLLYITPERFRSRGFLNALNMRLQSDGGLEYIVFDEAHCVSQWGNEFRPDYLNGAKVVWQKRQQCEQNFPILLFSATVSEKVYNDFNMIFS